MDDSHACLKKDHVQEFHEHLNSIDPNIRFRKEIEEENKLSFLNTTTSRVRGHIQVGVYVYRKPTHTDKYLDLTNAEPSTERKHVIKMLRENNYPFRFIQSCKSCHDTPTHGESNNSVTSTTNTTPTSNTFVVLPRTSAVFYVRGASEKLS